MATSLSGGLFHHCHVVPPCFSVTVMQLTTFLSKSLSFSVIYVDNIFFFCNQPTRTDRGWLVMPFGKNPWWWYLASSVPALLVTILIFMDQQISAVIVNRKENKLKVLTENRRLILKKKIRNKILC